MGLGPGHGFLIALVSALLPLTFGQNGADQAALAANMKKFAEVYGLATQIMNLGGNFINNAGGPSPARDSSAGNGVLGEIVRPQLRGVSNFEPSYYERSSGGGGAASLLSGYGGGPLGQGSQSRPRSIIDTLMGSFLGSSLGGGGPSATSSAASSGSNFFSPSYDESYGSSASRYGSAQQGSNIQAIMAALTRSGAQPAARDESSGGGAGSFLSQLFGGR